MTQTAYLNGAFVDADDANVSIFDGGWLHGAGLFETMRAENRCVFRLEAHLARLCRSAATILAPIDRDALPTADALAELLERNELDAARLRLTVSAGRVDGAKPDSTPQLTVIVTAGNLASYPDSFYARGVPVAICPYRQSPTDPLAGHKVTGHLSRLLGLREARQADCVEGLWFTTANRLAEGSISNVFVISEGTLKTPPLDTPVLPGIARGVVLAIARDEGIEAHECPLTIEDVLGADEILLTNAIMQVLPVIRVEKHDLNDGRVGPLAKRLLEGYRDRVRKECGSA